MKLGVRVALALIIALVLTFLVINFLGGELNPGAVGIIFVACWAAAELVVEVLAFLFRRGAD